MGKKNKVKDTLYFIVHTLRVNNNIEIVSVLNFNYTYRAKREFPPVENLTAFYIAYLELVSKGLNHLAAILHVYSEFYEVKKCFVIIFQKENENTFTLLIILIVKSLQKEQNSTNLLL